MELSTLAEIIWFCGISIFSLIVMLGKSKKGDRGRDIKAGSLFLIVSYLGLTQEASLSYTEIDILKWGIRVGITLIMFDLAKRTQVPTPSEFLKSVKLKLTFIKTKLRGNK